MFHWSSLLLLAIFISDSLSREVDLCYVNDDDPYLYLGTKTAYTFVGGRTRLQPIPNCQPLQVWSIIRHGAHYPGTDKITKLRSLSKFRDQIIENHEQKKTGRMCNQDLDNLKIWSPDPDMKEENAKKLTTQGIEDIKLFARRLQSDFPELLQPTFADITSKNYVFRNSGSQRTQSSLDAFVEGFFNKVGVSTALLSQNEDAWLKTYKNCSRGKDSDQIDSDILEERSKFLMRPEFMNAVQNISGRLGFKYNLSQEAIFLMYDMCRYEKSWVINRISSWCAIFSADELKIIEYSEDIYYHYEAGSGRDVNDQLGCIPLQDMFKHFQEIENGDVTDKPKGVFHFTHSMPMLSFLNSIGIGKDEQPLLSTNYREMTRRHWRTSFLGPFNSNLVAIFYRCNDKTAPNQVMFYLQEKPLQYEGCKVGLCDWEYLKNKLGGIASQCNPEICGSSTTSFFNRSIVYSLLATVLVFNWLI
ncbi:multiple inositol polyphosphate phosphatase 1-like [Microplitis mediator]|uniref:multiple inositol polyphosphate phosphatase 1-like n=1 Tax=Microplitis mediator TaxID=375433 RepID=UPI00255696B1|nr:multiple inositol polyphosphate phosphatase 1-like [Microplitis mediator]